jgi:RHS repeat-associated protein
VANQLTGFSYGNSVAASFGYSATRLQLASAAYTQSSTNLLSLSYNYDQDSGSGVKNNGQIAGISDNVESGRSATYTYDARKRLATAGTTGSTPYPQWGLSWTYDDYGNRTAQSVTAGSGPSNSVTVSTSTNRITAMGGYTFYYDANGNLTQDDLYKFKYDAENRLVEVKNLSDTLIATYAFDGNWMRTIKVVGADRTWYLYAGNELVSEYEDAASATYSSGTNPGGAGSDAGALFLYQHDDHLTTRLTTDQQGNLSNEQAHYPYGEAWYAAGTADPSVERKYTSYLKDSEVATGRLSYAIYREHSSRVARFLTPDPAGITDDLNRYAYVGNDPIRFSDASGLRRQGREMGDGPGGGGTGDRFSGVFGFNIHENFAGTLPVTGTIFGTGGTGTAGTGSCGYTGMQFQGGVGMIPCLPPGPPPPQRRIHVCFAQLKYRTSRRVPACTHAFWYIQRSDGKPYILAGYESGFFIGLEVTQGVVSARDPEDNISQAVHFRSVESAYYCPWVERMYKKAQEFPGGTIPYDLVFGPTSNSVARYLGEVGGFAVTRPPSSCLWEASISW